MVRQVLQKDLCWINPSVGVGRDVAVDDDNLLIGQAPVKKGRAVASKRERLRQCGAGRSCVSPQAEKGDSRHANGRR